MTLTNVPVNKGVLGVHYIELEVLVGEHLRDGGGVGDHAHGALHFGKITTEHNGRTLVVDAALEASGAPINELDGVLGLDGGNGGVDILGNNVTTEHEARSHVLAVMRVALDHHGGGLEHSGGDLGNDGAEPIDGPLLMAEPTANEKSCAFAVRLRACDARTCRACALTAGVILMPWRRREFYL
jgi:hypothetical protein